MDYKPHCGSIRGRDYWTLFRGFVIQNDHDIIAFNNGCTEDSTYCIALTRAGVLDSGQWTGQWTGNFQVAELLNAESLWSGSDRPFFPPNL